MVLKILKTIIPVCILLWANTTANAQYLIQSQWGNFEQCDTMTRGIYIVWWDNMNNLTEDADILLDSMLVYRDICLEELQMQDPPNPVNGFYYNVYLHQNGDIFPDGWGNGQGTDPFGYPYLTLPIGAHEDYVNVSHETFHIFQYSANAPGFAYSGDSQWYIEASANWFAGIRYKDEDHTFREAESLVRVPFVPLWLSFDNFPSYYPQNWQRYVHQYALALLLFYMTEEADVPHSIITSGMYSGTNELPQEYFFNQLGGSIFREHFINWAAHMTNDYDFLTPEQAAFNQLEWQTYADLWDDKEYVLILDDNGTYNWYRPPDSVVTTGWSFNTYKILNVSNDHYLFELNGDLYGSEGDLSFFDALVLVRGINSPAGFYHLNMENGQQGSLSVEVTPEDTELFFIVASMPETFVGVDQMYSYEIRIIKGIPTSTPEENSSAIKSSEQGRFNILGQPVGKENQGYQIILYDDGTTKKIFNVPYK